MRVDGPGAQSRTILVVSAGYQHGVRIQSQVKAQLRKETTDRRS